MKQLLTHLDLKYELMPMDHVSTQEAFVHLMNAAYQLPLNPTMSLWQLEMMITVQWKNCF